MTITTSKLAITLTLSILVSFAAPMSAMPVAPDAGLVADAATVTIEMIDNGYSDENGLPVTAITAGDSVRFSNTGALPHTATDMLGGFDSGTVNSGGSATVAFPEAGVFVYTCQFHANMAGVLVVA